jgi:serine/threonine-protein kinase RsbW
VGEPREIAFLIESRLQNVSFVGLSINRICRDLGFDEAEAHNVELSAVESLTNVIRHAYGLAPDRPVIARLTAHDDRIELRVMHQGAPVPEHKRGVPAPPEEPDDPMKLAEGGRGLFLIHTLMDRVEYETEGDAHVVLLTKARPVTADQGETR